MSKSASAAFAAATHSGKKKTAPARAAAPDARALISAPTRALLDQFRLDNVVTHLVRRAHFLAEDIFAQEFATESITPRQKAALVIVYQHPGLNQNALAERLFVDRNTVAEMVRRLVANGLLMRVAAARDQRAYELSLAPDGAALLDRVIARDLRVERNMLERLPEEYRALFLECLRLIVDPSARGE